MRITATDLELSIHTECEAKVKKEGAGTIPAKKLLDLVRLLPEGEIRFKLLENHWVQITSDRRTYKMVGMAKDNFPGVPAFPARAGENTREHSLCPDRQDGLCDFYGGFALHAERRAAHPQARYDHRGGHRRASSGVGRDRSRICRALERGAHADTEKSPDEDSASGRRPAKKGRSNSRATTAIYFFRSGRDLLISRILPANFPITKPCCLERTTKPLSSIANELNDAVRRVSQLADQRSHAVKFSVSPDGVELSASSPEYGEAKETIENDYKGEAISIGFNGQYLLDFLGAAADGPISVELKDEQSAGQFARSPTNSTAIATSSCPCASEAPATLPARFSAAILTN